MWIIDVLEFGYQPEPLIRLKGEKDGAKKNHGTGSL
jgi:hypothetical protein